MKERGEMLDMRPEESYYREYNIFMNYAIGLIAELQNAQVYLPDKAKRRIEEFASRRNNIFLEWTDFARQEEKTSEEKIKVLKNAISMLKELQDDIKKFEIKNFPKK